MAAPRRLADVIRTQRDEILRRWEQGVRALPHASALDEPRLVDHIPELLERIALMTEELGRGVPPTAPRTASELHALARLDEGYDVLEVIAEFRVLRDVVFQLFYAPHAEDLRVDETRVLNTAIDTAITASVGRYQHVLREQTQHATEQLGESERQFRALADNIPQLAWMTDASGSTYWQNRRWYDYTGTTPNASRGWGWQEMVQPEHLARVLERWRAAVDGGCAWEDTFPLRGQDGRYRWFLSRAVPIRDEHGAIERWFGTNTDVTARRLLERAATLLAGSLDYRATLEQLARLAVPELADWCLVDLLENGRLEHLAIAHADARGLDLVTAYARAHPPDLASEPGTREVLHTGQVRIVPDVTDEILGRITDPERLRALRELDVHSWIGAPLLARGATLGVLHLVRSGSNQRYGAAEVELANELAQRAGTAVDNARLYRDAQRAVRAREDVLAIVSHDLRNPLAAIDLGATMLLQKPETDRTTRTQLERILRGGQRMKALIDDLLDMASINTGRFELQRTRLDAGELMTEVVEAHEAVATERGIRLVCAYDVQGVPLLADRNRLLQVFGNLIGNALKFCDAGDEVTVRGLREGEQFRFVVADTGPGIPDAELPHIFEPYWSGRATKREGTGLGLFITRAIVEAHGGTIAARSEAGRGSTFTVTLPVAAP